MGMSFQRSLCLPEGKTDDMALWTSVVLRGQWHRDMAGKNLREKIASWMGVVVGIWGDISSLKLTAKAPENRPKPNRKGSYSKHPFLEALVLGSVVWCSPRKAQGPKETLSPPKMGLGMLGILDGDPFCWELLPRKLTWQWNIHHLKMYFLLKIGIFQCHVCELRGVFLRVKKKGVVPFFKTTWLMSRWNFGSEDTSFHRKWWWKVREMGPRKFSREIDRLVKYYEPFGQMVRYASVVCFFPSLFLNNPSLVVPGRS